MLDNIKRSKERYYNTKHIFFFSLDLRYLCSALSQKFDIQNWLFLWQETYTYIEQ